MDLITYDTFVDESLYFFPSISSSLHSKVIGNLFLLFATSANCVDRGFCFFSVL